MPQEREYTGQSLNRIDTLNKNLVENHQKIEKNKQIIDSYIFADPSRIDDPTFKSKSAVVRSQDQDNLQKAKEFSQNNFHELVDIALEDAARAGKTIIDARDFYEPKPARTTNDFLLEEESPLRVPGKQNIVDAREAVVQRYCAENGIDPHELTLDELSKIRSLPEWQNPLGKE